MHLTLPDSPFYYRQLLKLPTSNGLVWKQKRCKPLKTLALPNTIHSQVIDNWNVSLLLWASCTVRVQPFYKKIQMRRRIKRIVKWVNIIHATSWRLQILKCSTEGIKNKKNLSLYSESSAKNFNISQISAFTSGGEGLGFETCWTWITWRHYRPKGQNWTFDTYALQHYHFMSK